MPAPAAAIPSDLDNILSLFIKKRDYPKSRAGSKFDSLVGSFWRTNSRRGALSNGCILVRIKFP